MIDSRFRTEYREAVLVRFGQFQNHLERLAAGAGTCNLSIYEQRVEQSSSDLKICCQHLANFALRYADAVESVMAGHEVNAMPTLDEEEAEE